MHVFLVKKYVGGICHNATCKSLSFRGLLSAFKQGVCKILTFSGDLYPISEQQYVAQQMSLLPALFCFLFS